MRVEDAPHTRHVCRTASPRINDRLRQIQRLSVQSLLDKSREMRVPTHLENAHQIVRGPEMALGARHVPRDRAIKPSIRGGDDGRKDRVVGVVIHRLSPLAHPDRLRSERTTQVHPLVHQ